MYILKIHKHKLKITFLTILCFGIFGIVKNSLAATYYISSSAGDDSRTAEQAQNKNTPWAHAPGMNSVASNGNLATEYNAHRTEADVFVFKGCDVWTWENFPWIIGTNTGYSLKGFYLNPGKKASDIGAQFLGDSDKTWYNTANCSDGWDRPIFDACKVSSPPIAGTNGNKPGCAGDNIAVIPTQQAQGYTQGYGHFLYIIPNHTTVSGIEFRNHYTPNDGAGGTGIYGGRQDTTYLTFRNNYIHSFIEEPPVQFMVTVPKNSNIIIPINPGDESKMSLDMPFQVLDTYAVFPPANNGPRVGSIDIVNHQFTAEQDGGGSPVPVYSFTDICSSSPGCLLSAGYGNFNISTMQGYPNSRMTSFEWNIVDGEDSNLVDNARATESNGCSSDWGKCIGPGGTLYQGPENVHHNLIRYVASFYLGAYGEMSYNRFEHIRRFVNPTGHDNLMEALGQSGRGGNVHDNVTTVASGVMVMVQPRVKYTTTASVNSGSYTITVTDPTTFCGTSPCGFGTWLVVKLVGAGPEGADLITYIEDINGNNITLIDAPSTTGSVSIVSGALSPTYIWNNIIANGANNYQIQPASAYGEMVVFNNTVEGGPNSLPNAPGIECPPLGNVNTTYGKCEIKNNIMIGCSGTNCDASRPFIDPSLCGSNCSPYTSNNVAQAFNQATAQGSTFSQTPFMFYPSMNSPVTGAGTNLSSYCSDSLISPFCVNGRIPDTSYGVRWQETRTSATSGTNYLVLGRTPTLRPASGAWDAGAYNITAGSDTTPPATPSGLNVQ